MATTVSTFPMRPIASMGGTLSSAMSVVPLDTSLSTITDGDVLVLEDSTGYAKVDNNADGVTAEQSIFGVAQVTGATTVTVTGTPDPEAQPGKNAAGTIDVVNVALALPGQLFAGNAIDNASNYTGVVATSLRKNFEIEAASHATETNFACVDVTAAATNPVVFTMGFVSPQWDHSTNAWFYGRNAGVGVVNPRVTFYWLHEATVFGTII